MKKDIPKLDYTSWFDLWHSHFDAKKNMSWKERKDFLTRLFSLYDSLNKKMIEHERHYQSWCYIDLDDSFEDAVYLHTQNPNQNNFPLVFEKSNRPFKCDHQLLKLVEDSGFEWFKLKGYRMIAVYKKGSGEKLF